MNLGPLTIDHIDQSNLIEGVSDPREIPKSVRAWTFLSSLKPEEFTDQCVFDVHRLVMDGLMHPADVGHYRVVGVQVGGRVCPHPLQVPELLNTWIADMRHQDDLDPKIKHVQFEKIHPFRDGNGRVGRLLMWWHEANLGLKPTLIKYDERWNYYSWFDEN